VPFSLLPTIMNGMRRLLDLLTTVGILINVAKGGDLLLREHQRKFVQSKAKSVAEYLDKLRPLNWFGKLTTSKTTKILLALLSMILYLGYSLRQGGTYVAPEELWRKIVFFLVMGFTVCVMLALFGYYFYSYVTYPVVGWLLKDNNVRLFLLRFSIITVAYLAFTCITKDHAYTAFWKVFLYAMLFVSLVLAWYAGAIILSLMIMIMIAQFLVFLMRALIWRIVEYNRGAWAAIVLIITIILGAVELLLRTR